MEDLELFVRDEMQHICVKMGDRIPATLDAVRQGIFALGFYQEQCELGRIRLRLGTFSRNNRSVRGEWMASKLEVHIADALAKAGIQYVYEARAVLKSGQIRCPDFFVEGAAPSQHIYLEVLGYSGAATKRSGRLNLTLTKKSASLPKEVTKAAWSCSIGAALGTAA